MLQKWLSSVYYDQRSIACQHILGVTEMCDPLSVFSLHFPTPAGGAEDKLKRGAIATSHF